MMKALTIVSLTPGSSAKRRREARRGNFQNLGFLRFAARRRQRRGPSEHPDFADEIARPGRGEDLLLPVARFKNLQLAAQDDDGEDRADPL